MEKNKQYNYYKNIAGNYIRTAIGQDNTDKDHQKNIEEQNLKLNITLTYLHGNQFSVDMEYWKRSNARAKGVIEL